MDKISNNELEDTGAIPLDDYSKDIERIAEIAEYNLEFGQDIFERLLICTSKILISEETLRAIAVGLIAGNIVLQGPPGTGKSSIARAISNAFNIELFPVTAHEDWSSYDLIGRQTITYNEFAKEEITPVNGYFTEAVIMCANSISSHFEFPNNPQATWLFIDELNRCHIDRAFGELFSVIGGGEGIPIILSHQNIGNRKLVTPNRFRIISTINSIDKQFVNSLSQAIKRRFTFITIDIPLQKKVNETWKYNDTSAIPALREFTIAINQAIERLYKSFNSIATKEKITELLTIKGIDAIKNLFDLIDSVRYSTKESESPFLPIGTAQIIDTIELFGTYALTFEKLNLPLGNLIDWASSVKIAPLFEADTINSSILEVFSEKLKEPFNNKTREEINKIAASGMFFIK